MKTIIATVLWCTFTGGVAPQPQQIKIYPAVYKCEKARIKYENHNISRGVKCACRREDQEEPGYKPAYAIKRK